MKKFGAIFKKFRESRGIRLKDVATGILITVCFRKRSDRLNHFKVYVGIGRD